MCSSDLGPVAEDVPGLGPVLEAARPVHEAAAEVGLLPAGRPGLAAPVGEGLGLAVAPGEVPEVPVPAVPGPATPREVAEVEVLSRDAA